MHKVLRMKASVALLVLFAMVCQGTWVLAGTTGGISGQVIDASTRTGIPNAKVTAVSPSQTASVYTDARGNYNFLSLGPDTYTVSIEKQGYDPYTQSGVTVFADQTATVNASARKSLQTIGRVTTRAAADVVRPGAVTDVYSVSAAQQSAAAALGGGGSLTQAYSGLASVPGVQIGAGQAGWNQAVYIRGGNYTDLGYEFDGVPIQRAYDQYPASALSALGQQELQVYVGSAPAGAQSSGWAVSSTRSSRPAPIRGSPTSTSRSARRPTTIAPASNWAARPRTGTSPGTSGLPATTSSSTTSTSSTAPR